MHRQRRRTFLTAAAAAAAFCLPAVAGAADTIVSPDAKAHSVSAQGGVLAWLSGTDDVDQLVVSKNGVATPVSSISPGWLGSPQVGPGADGSTKVVLPGGCKACVQEVDATTLKRTIVNTHSEAGCFVDAAALWRSTLAYTLSGQNCDSYGLWVKRAGHRPRHLARQTADAVSTDGKYIATLVDASESSSIRVDRADGSGGFVLSRNTDDGYGGEGEMRAPVVRAGVVTWADGGVGENGASTTLVRARAKRGATCFEDRARLRSGDLDRLYDSVAVDGSRVYFAEVANDDDVDVVLPGIVQVTAPAPKFTYLRTKAHGRGVGVNC